LDLAVLKRFGGFDEQARRSTLKKMQNPVKVLVDRVPGRIGFNEHAETGKPDIPSDRD
jgi:hypothetical protein